MVAAEGWGGGNSFGGSREGRARVAGEAAGGDQSRLFRLPPSLSWPHSISLAPRCHWLSASPPRCRPPSALLFFRAASPNLRRLPPCPSPSVWSFGIFPSPLFPAPAQRARVLCGQPGPALPGLHALDPGCWTLDASSSTAACLAGPGLAWPGAPRPPAAVARLTACYASSPML